MLRGTEWTVAQWTGYADCEALRLEGVPGSSSQTFLLPFDRPRRIPQGQIAVVTPRAWVHAFARILLDEMPYGGLQDWPPNLELLAYQLEPALAMLRDGHPRLLIADEVGLGKTIETGLILRELSRRSGDFKALILTPAGLREQWRDELSARLSVATVLADADWLRAMGRCLPPDVNPWSPPGIYVASFDFVKRPEALRALEDARWDLLVVDEAHAASVTTDRRAAIDGIARRSHRVVLLTATPPADHTQFNALCQIGALPDDPAIVLFRRERREDGRRARRSILLSVRLTKEERHLHRMLERYTKLVWREARRSENSHSLLLTTTLRKRALSSLSSLSASLQRRRDLLAAFASPLELQMFLPLDRQDDGAREDAVGDDVLVAAGLSDAEDERRWIDAMLMESAAASTRDSKSRVLIRLLTRIRQPALVFTEYRDTLETLRVRLNASGLSVCALHGGLTSDERRKVLQEFARGGKTLLATDAAAEGLNLQKACRVVVHYELPWNPSRMLQRAGRVDRMGQQHRVHEIALLASDSAESLVLAPLARRAMNWTLGTTGDRMLELFTESRVAELVFDGAVPSATSPPTEHLQHAQLDLSADARSEAARLERRVLLSSTAPTTASWHRSVAVSTLRRSSLRPGSILIFDIKTCAHDGCVIARESISIHVPLALPRWPRTRRLIKQMMSGLLPSLRTAVSPFLEAAQHRQREAVSMSFQQTTDRMQRRGVAVRRMHESVARQLVQAGLFDRRPRRDARRGSDELEFDGSSIDGRTIGDAVSSSAELRAVLMVRPR